jgi:hypothetical protein
MTNSHISDDTDSTHVARPWLLQAVQCAALDYDTADPWECSSAPGPCWAPAAGCLSPASAVRYA